MIAGLNILSTALKGCLLGVANIIPGVSGGTMALILGIYERLIKSLNNVDLGFLKACVALVSMAPGAKKNFLAQLQRIDFWFVLTLVLGAVGAIFASSKLIVFFLSAYHDPTYGFFLGLILVSIVVPWRMMRRCGLKEVVVMFLAVTLTITVTRSMSGEERLEHAVKKQQLTQSAKNEDSSIRGNSAGKRDFSYLAWIFCSAAIAISAMILPGISGSFLMILLGVYFDILEAISQFDFVVLSVFVAGMGVGILVFARFLNYVFEHFFDPTIGFLVGLMVGSLYGLWPFRDYELVDGKRIDLGLILPSFDINFLVTLGTFFAGGGMIALMVIFFPSENDQLGKGRR